MDTWKVVPYINVLLILPVHEPVAMFCQWLGVSQNRGFASHGTRTVAVVMFCTLKTLELVIFFDIGLLYSNGVSYLDVVPFAFYGSRHNACSLCMLKHKLS